MFRPTPRTEVCSGGFTSRPSSLALRAANFAQILFLKHYLNPDNEWACPQPLYNENLNKKVSRKIPSIRLFYVIIEGGDLKKYEQSSFSSGCDHKLFESWISTWLLLLGSIIEFQRSLGDRKFVNPPLVSLEETEPNSKISYYIPCFRNFSSCKIRPECALA